MTARVPAGDARASTGAPRGRALVVGAATVLVLGVGLVTAVPLGAGTWPVAQVVALRGVAALAAAVAAAVVLAVRPARRVLRPVAVACALVALAHAGVLAARSLPASDAGAHAVADGSVPAGDLVVLTFNTLDAVPATTLADLVSDVRADVVALPETSRATADELGALLPGDGWQVLHAPSEVPWIAGTALLVDARVGRYPHAERLDNRLGTLRATPAGAGPVLVAAHPLAPTTRRAMAGWRAETAVVADACRTTPDVVVAGDLNATLDHPALRDTAPCVDAARAAGAAALGTWPAAVPSVLAAPIDHVLVDGRAWRVVDARVLPRVGASDHRPLVAVLARR